MPTIESLECSRCGKTVSADTPQTVCPDCAGTLYVRYDLRPLRGTASRDAIAREAERSPWLGMWRYRSVLPAVSPVTLGEGWTPMLPSRRFPHVFLKEEGANPTSSVQGARPRARRHDGSPLWPEETRRAIGRKCGGRPRRLRSRCRHRSAHLHAERCPAGQLRRGDGVRR